MSLYNDESDNFYQSRLIKKLTTKKPSRSPYQETDSQLLYSNSVNSNLIDDFDPEL